MTSSRANGRPNIVLIVLDCVRADHLSCYGYGRETSPMIDRLAAEGTLFEQAISPSPWTLPSHASLFTGTYVSTHRTDLDTRALDPSFITMAEVLKQTGYRTIGLSSNVWVGPITGLHKGFDRFDNMNRPPYESGRRLKPHQKLINAFYWRYRYKRYDYGARELNRTLRGLLHGSNGAAPFFVFINYLEAHLKYDPPRQYRHAFLRKEEDRPVTQDPWGYLVGAVALDAQDFYILNALYDAEIRYLDFRVAEVVRMLEQMHALDNTLLIITADHGENIGEHGLMDHQFSVHDSLIRVPLIIRYPGVFPKGARISHQVQSVDLFSTLCDLLRVSNDALRAQLQGTSLLPTLAGAPVRHYAFSEYLVPNLKHFERNFAGYDYSKFRTAYRAVRTDRFKLIAPVNNGQGRLFNLQADPREEADTAPGQPQLCDELAGALAKWSTDLASTRARRQVEFDEDTVTMLKSLGYM